MSRSWLGDFAALLLVVGMSAFLVACGGGKATKTECERMANTLVAAERARYGHPVPTPGTLGAMFESDIAVGVVTQCTGRWSKSKVACVEKETPPPGKELEAACNK